MVFRFILVAAYCFCLTPLCAFADGDTDTNVDLPEINYLFQGRIIFPADDDNQWKKTDPETNNNEVTLDVPIYGKIELQWDIPEIIRRNFLNDCQIRKSKKNGNNVQIVVTGVSFSGTKEITMEEATIGGGNNEGDYYSIYCKQPPPDPITVAYEEDPYAQISGLGEVAADVHWCETSFESIVKRTNIIPGGDDWGVTNITEDSFQSWLQNDIEDRCLFLGEECTADHDISERKRPRRSGDKNDAMAAMVATYCEVPEEPIGPPPPADERQNHYYDSGSTILERIKHYTERNIVVPFVIRLPEQSIREQSSSVGGHMLLALSVSYSANEVTIESLDPNGPKLTNVICNLEPMRLESPYWVFIADMNCYHEDWGIVALTPLDPEAGEHYLSPGSFQARQISWHLARVYEHCIEPSNQETEFCQRKGNWTDWLRTNYPNVSNFDYLGRGGFCDRWTDFVLAITYLGNFVGECPKP